MRRKLIPVTLTGLVGAVSLGVFGVTGTTVASDDTDTWAKREEQSPELVLVSDDDPDDDFDADGDGDDEATNSADGTASGTVSAAGDGTGATNSVETGQTGTGTATNTGGANSTGDHTNSAVTRVSRDGEASVGDLTKDFTTDGPGVGNRDLTPNLTNDASKNDTRGR